MHILGYLVWSPEGRAKRLLRGALDPAQASHKLARSFWGHWRYEPTPIHFIHATKQFQFLSGPMPYASGIIRIRSIH